MNFKSLATVLFACAAAYAQAGFTKSVVLDSSYDATQPLQDGTVYIVEESQSSVGKYDGKSGYAVAPLPVVESLKDFKEKADDRSF
ncbi:MAG: hypothetical protein IKK82_12865 [Kiritimatiellae bacterium]|nr:hypothetical protein [Kiritimatiellia bacterium]